jgi:hypothetical protein
MAIQKNLSRTSLKVEAISVVSKPADEISKIYEIEE